MSKDATVYVVDDDEASAASLEALLSVNRFCVRKFHSAEDFLATYVSNGKTVLVLDVRLEKMSGLTLLKTLTARGTAPPTVLISGYADDGLRDEARRHGALAVLEKPLSGRQLCDILHSAIESE